MTNMRRQTWFLVGSLSVTAACSSSVPLPVQYAVLVDDWHGDFLRNPVTGFDSSLPVPLVGQSRRDRCAAGVSAPGWRGGRGWHARGQPHDRWPGSSATGGGDRSHLRCRCLAAFDARSYRPRRLQVLYWGQAIDDVAYARFRVGDGVDWIRTRTSTVSETGEITLSVQLSSPVPLPDLDETRVEVRRGAEDIACTLFPLDVPTTRSLELLCPTLAVGDRIEVRVQSDFVGHPTGEMVSHAFVVGAQASYDVAPELALDVLRAAYAIEGGGT